MSQDEDMSPEEVDLRNDEEYRKPPLWIRIKDVSYNVDVAYKMVAMFKDRDKSEEPDFCLHYVTGEKIDVTKKDSPAAHDVMRVYFDYRERPFIEEVEHKEL